MAAQLRAQRFVSQQRPEPRDSAQRVYETGVWVVENRRGVYLRANNANARWLARIMQDPEVSLDRDGTLRRYRAHVSPDQRAQVNGLMVERYGWADWLVGLVFQRENAVPIALVPISD